MTEEILKALKKEFKKRKQGNKETAKQHLQEAGIIDKDGKVNDIYKNVFIRRNK